MKLEHLASLTLKSDQILHPVQMEEGPLLRENHIQLGLSYQLISAATICLIDPTADQRLL